MDGLNPELTLEQLLSLPIEAPSPLHPLTAREAPGVVTVITRDEILASGARDLVDVLRMVPGFFFGVDVEGAVGAGFRGVWGHEGKILYQVDGIAMNELDYSTWEFGGRFPVEQIERVEVVRGPGSVTHGDFAELAVVNIVTHEPLDGVRATAGYGQMVRGYARSSVGVQGGGRFPVPELLLSASAYVADTQRSDGTYVDLSGNRADLTGASPLDARYLNLGARWRGLRVRLLYDGYHIVTSDGVGPVIPPTPESFEGMYGAMTYEIPLTPSLTLTPGFQYQRQLPWRVTDRTSPIFSDRYVERFVEHADLRWKAAKSVDVVGGMEVTEEHGRLLDPALVGLQRLYSNGQTQVWYGEYASFAEVSWDSPVALLVGGFRAEEHLQYGPSFVPRVAVSHRWGPLHGKLMYSQAYRAPGIQNLAVNPDLLPERTQTFEAEVGSRLGPWAIATVSGFDTTIRRTIVYSVDTTDGTATEQYSNGGTTGSRGVEGELRAFFPAGHAGLGYSFYTAAGKNEVAAYRVDGQDAVLLGAPAHSATAHASIRPVRALSVGPSVTLLGPRYAWAWSEDSGKSQLTRLPPAVIVNLWVSWADVVPGLGVGLGVFDLLDAHPAYPQPYVSDHAPLPGPSREILVRFTWDAGL